MICEWARFVVKADARILDRTLLCEYVGEVATLEHRLHGDCDSLMELLRTGDPTSTLIISPKCVGTSPNVVCAPCVSTPLWRHRCDDLA